ncbi:hypothetical protein BDL97_14G069100 [Sphagnum fallax]|nr:hypothetical protein BDL97_14G069100 [Sphagnum fallax]
MLCMMIDDEFSKCSFVCLCFNSCPVHAGNSQRSKLRFLQVVRKDGLTKGLPRISVGSFFSDCLFSLFTTCK